MHSLTEVQRGCATRMIKRTGIDVMPFQEYLVHLSQERLCKGDESQRGNVSIVWVKAGKRANTPPKMEHDQRRKPKRDDATHLNGSHRAESRR